MPALARPIRTRIVHLCVVAVAIGLVAGTATARAGTSYVDGISDQSLPTWDGSFATSSFARVFRATWLGQITLARYALQWNAMSETSSGPNSDGDYRERFEAWLDDVQSLGLAPVIALTSYNHVYPNAAGEYQQELEALLEDAAGDGEPIGYVEAWNEPNNQGGETAARAGEIADWAHVTCAQRGCQVIAGDFEDNASLPSYEQAYVVALTFAPGVWGIHPYQSVKAHDDTGVVRFVQGLPNEGVDAQIWFTEVGAYYCAHGQVRGEAQQASDVSYLLDTLIPAITPTHVFYYGFMAGNGSEVPCAAPDDFDTELYRASHQPRIAAQAILSAGSYHPLQLRSRPIEELLSFAPPSAT